MPKNLASLQRIQHARRLKGQAPRSGLSGIDRDWGRLDDSAVLFHVRDAPTTAATPPRRTTKGRHSLSLARPLSLSDPIGFVVSVSISATTAVTPIATVELIQSPARAE